MAWAPKIISVCSGEPARMAPLGFHMQTYLYIIFLDLKAWAYLDVVLDQLVKSIC